MVRGVSPAVAGEGVGLELEGVWWGRGQGAEVALDGVLNDFGHVVERDEGIACCAYVRMYACAREYVCACACACVCLFRG